ncbi:hypothetical protein H0H92_002478 [Tricholoma furcatifolium]|nr:hypothetical protein H0H92_002478 [Tricholoma furcatifolium]
MAASSSITQTRSRARTKKQEKPATFSKSRSKPTPKATSENEDDDQDDDYHGGADEVDSQSEKDEETYDSDAIDEDDFKVGSKRKRNASGSGRSPKKPATAQSPRKRVKTKKTRKPKGGEEEDAPEVEDGQEIVGVVVQAPTTGQVPPGQISQNTLNFLKDLKKPECNDRQWFKLHEPVYRQAENEWKAFIEAFTEHLTEADPQVPPLPPKDVIHRIYRDIRFSNDKTPYKTGFSASFSRSGRKGIWAGFKPGGESMLAAGTWCPGRNELANIRTNIQRPNGSDRLREVLAAPEFVSYFGEPRPAKDGSRQSVFGMEDELKVAPKGVDKTHPDIDLLKCRSFAVVHKFLDSEVLEEDFAEKVGEVVRVMRPLVHCLNDMMTVAANSDGSDEEGE